MVKQFIYIYYILWQQRLIYLHSNRAALTWWRHDVCTTSLVFILRPISTEMYYEEIWTGQLIIFFPILGCGCNRKNGDRISTLIFFHTVCRKIVESITSHGTTK